MKTAFPYYGGKSRIAERVVDLLSPHRIYVEPYCGSAAVLLAKRTSAHEIINDLDGNVVAFFEALRDQPDELHRLLALTPYSAEEYLKASHTDGDISQIERARRFMIRTSQSVNAAGNGGSAGWALSTSRNQSRPGTFAGAVDRLPQVAERLRRVAVMNTDAIEVVRRWAGNPEAAIYADPPYLASTRRTVGRSAYRMDIASDRHHEDLLSVIADAKAQVILSGYASEVYAVALPDWHVLHLAATKPSANRNGGSAQHAVETLWVNRLPEGWTPERLTA